MSDPTPAYHVRYPHKTVGKHGKVLMGAPVIFYGNRPVLVVPWSDTHEAHKLRNKLREAHERGRSEALAAALRARDAEVELVMDLTYDPAISREAARIRREAVEECARVADRLTTTMSARTNAYERGWSGCASEIARTIRSLLPPVAEPAPEVKP